MIKVTSEELKKLMDHMISNNQKLQELGFTPIAMKVMGESGIGKTSTLISIAKEHGLQLHKLNLAQIEDLGDLVGYPTQEFQMYKEVTVERPVDPNDPSKGTKTVTGKKAKWVDKKMVDIFKSNGFIATGNARMGYALPGWLSSAKEGGVLLLDDFNRANPKFQNAIMELVDRQTYYEWKLPNNWHIVLTGNPDNGDYMVTEDDKAQKTRMMSIEMYYDVEAWARWAESANIDERCINFMLLNEDLIQGDLNARIATIFFNSIRSIKDLRKELNLVNMLAESSVGREFAALFTTFINDNMNKFISPSDVLIKSEEATALKKLKDAIYDDPADKNTYRTDIASITAFRIINFLITYANKKDAKGNTNKITPALTDRIEKIVSNKDLFTEDLIYFILRELYRKGGDRFKKLFYNPALLAIAAK